MKPTFWLLGLLLLSPLCYADMPESTSTGNPNWTINRAKKEAFKKSPAVFDTSTLPEADPNRLDNQALIQKGGGKTALREISVFSNGLYSVSGACSNRTYYYYPNGRLSTVDVSSSPVYAASDCSAAMPRTFWKYSLDGQLIRVGLDVGQDETYIFRKNGDFDVHWVNDTCYGPNGSPCPDTAPTP